MIRLRETRPRPREDDDLDLLLLAPPLAPSAAAGLEPAAWCEECAAPIPAGWGLRTRGVDLCGMDCQQRWLASS